MCIVLIFWIVKMTNVMIDFAPFFFVWSIPVLVITIVWTPAFYIYCVLYIVFCGLKSAVEVQKEVLP